MFPPTSGTAFLDGKDITTQIKDARQSLGLCPQHNILFNKLTVREHIEFFASLKGISGKEELEAEVQKYVALIGLQDKIDALSRTLSGGMKRKLSIGIALCGNSKIVICDEPSSGVDPSARRELWDLLIAEKKNRTILLTTHHMDEADILGDRIAIMAEGQLRTVGSSFFLKKKFGTGYKLICEKQSHCVAKPILDLVKLFAKGSYIESDTPTELVIVISEEYLPYFHNIFLRLEKDATALGVSSFGCSLTTLEEVFLKLGTDTGINTSDSLSETADSSGLLVNSSEFTSPNKVTGIKLKLYQMYAMILKKYHYLKWNYSSIVILTVFSILGIGLLKYSFTSSSIKSLDITFDTYVGSTTVIEHDKTSTDLVKSYESLLGGQNQVELIEESFSEFILKLSTKSRLTVNDQYLIGATIKADKVTAWYNGQPYHSLPLTVNTVNRAILRSFAGAGYDISVTNQPFRKSSDADGFPEDLESFTKSFVIFFVLLIYWPSIFVGFYIKERASRAKLLQYISGANRFVYWLTNFMVDYVIFFVLLLLLVTGIALVEVPLVKSEDFFLTMLSILMCYGCSMVPFVFLFSFFFNKHSTGEVMVVLVGFICKL